MAVLMKYGLVEAAEAVRSRVHRRSSGSEASPAGGPITEHHSRPERLRLALSSAEMGTWRWNTVTDRDTRDASFNRILGLKAIETTQSVEDFLKLVHPNDRTTLNEKIQRAVREHETYMAEFRLIRPTGEIRWLRDR